MRVLVVGATGMTGGCLVEQLLAKDHRVCAIARSPQKFPKQQLDNPNLEVITAAVLDLTDEEMLEQVKDCDAVVSCLGHVLSFRGMFGQPRKLCTDATRRLCCAIEKTEGTKATRFILMNTVGVRNPEAHENRSWPERALLGVLRYTIPPHRDNETAATYLQKSVGQENRHIEWCSVRPDSLVNGEVSAYDVEESPVTGILSGRPTTRSNVAHFMVELIDDEELWNSWKFKMPVIMNTDTN